MPRNDHGDDDSASPPWKKQAVTLIAFAMVGVSAVVIYLLHRETFSPVWSARATRGEGGR